MTYANRPTATPETVPTGQNIQQLARWLMLNKEKAARNRAESMLRRSAYEVGLVSVERKLLEVDEIMRVSADGSGTSGELQEAMPKAPLTRGAGDSSYNLRRKK